MIYQSHQLSEALAMITQEDVIVFPTDTVYGIGASIHSPNALDKIFEIKNRFWVDVIDEFSKKIFLSFDKVASKKEFAQKDELLETLYSQIKSRIGKINL